MNSETQSNEKKDFIQRFLSYLPILTLLSLAWGIISQLVYYYPFNLDILTYTEVNEIILNTFNGLIACVLIYLIPQILIHILVQIILYHRIKKKGIIDITDERLSLRLTVKMANRIVIIISSFLTIMLIVGLVYIHNVEVKFNLETKQYNQEVQKLNKTLLSHNHALPQIKQLLYQENRSSTKLEIGLIVIYLTILLSLTTLIYLKLFYENNYFKPLNPRYPFLIAMSIFILGNIIANNIHASARLGLYSTYGTYIEMGSKKIVSTEDYYYIGRTKNFVFFYDVKRDGTDVYQNKDITMLSIKNESAQTAIKSMELNRTKILASIKKQLDTVNKKEIDSLEKKYSILKSKFDSLNYKRK